MPSEKEIKENAREAAHDAYVKSPGPDSKAIQAAVNAAIDCCLSAAGKERDELRDWLEDQEAYAKQTGSDYEIGARHAYALAKDFLNDLQEQSTPKEER